MKDYYGNPIKRGDILGLAFIGYSGSGNAQHLVKVCVASNSAGLTLKTTVECPGHYYKRGTLLSEVLRWATFSKVLKGDAAHRFPGGERKFIWADDFPFKKRKAQP